MIKLDNINYIETDKYNWILVFHTKNKHEIGTMLGNGKTVVNEYSSNSTYHGTLEQALNTYVDERLKNVEGDLKAVLEALKQIREDIKHIKYEKSN